MKKLLTAILILLLLILLVFIVLQGFSIGSLEVLSYKNLGERSSELDKKIQEASKLAEKDFKQAMTTINESGKKLEKVKKQYEEIASTNSENDVEQVSQLQKYEIETLWVKLGNYATSEGVVIKMDIVNGKEESKGVYDLKFTTNGSYISITDFISDIENDTTLGFKIEEFKMVPGGSGLQATFVCKDISIEQLTQTSNENTKEKGNENSEEKENENSEKAEKNENSTNESTNTNSKNEKSNSTTSNSTNSNNNTQEKSNSVINDMM